MLEVHLTVYVSAHLRGLLEGGSVSKLSCLKTHCMLHRLDFASLELRTKPDQTHVPVLCRSFLITDMIAVEPAVSGCLFKAGKEQEGSNLVATTTNKTSHCL